LVSGALEMTLEEQMDDWIIIHNEDFFVRLCTINNLRSKRTLGPDISNCNATLHRLI